MECWPTPHFGLNFLLRSSVYLNMCPWVAALESTAQMHEMARLYVRSISNVLNSHKTRCHVSAQINYCTRLAIVATPTEYGCTQRHMVKYRSHPCSGLVTVAEINSSCCYYSNYEASVGNLPGRSALSSIKAMLIPRISAHPPILAQCKVHRPWVLAPLRGYGTCNNIIMLVSLTFCSSCPTCSW